MLTASKVDQHVSTEGLLSLRYEPEFIVLGQTHIKVIRAADDDDEW